MREAQREELRRGARAASGAPIERKTARRPAPVSVRVNAEERAELEARAGDMALSSFLKLCALGDAASVETPKRRRACSADRKLLAEVLARLGSSRMASNLNQIAKAANLGVINVDADLERELAQACVDVAWMRIKLAEALGVRSADKDRP